MNAKLRWRAVRDPLELWRETAHVWPRFRSCAGPVFGSHEWITAYVNNLLTEDPLFLVAYESEVPRGVALFCTDGHILKTLYRDRIDVAPVVLSEPGYRAQLTASLPLALERAGLSSTVDFYSVSEQEVAQLFSDVVVGYSWTCPVVDLPDWRANASRQLLRTVRKRRRRLEREIGPVNFVASRIDVQSISALSDHSVKWRALRGERPFISNESEARFFQQLLTPLSARGESFIGQLWAGKRLASSHLSFTHDGRTMMFIQASDVELRHLSPGTVALACALDDAASRGQREFDFLRGAEAYKYRFGAQDRYQVISGRGNLAGQATVSG